MNKIGNILLIAIEALGVSAYSQTPTENSIRAAVERQITIYPNSTLRDIYKNFFRTISVQGILLWILMLQHDT